MFKYLGYRTYRVAHWEVKSLATTVSVAHLVIGSMAHGPVHLYTPGFRSQKSQNNPTQNNVSHTHKDPLA